MARDSPGNIAAVTGLLIGAKNPMDMNDEEIAKAGELPRHIHSNMRFYWTGNTELEQSLASGEIVAAWDWGQSVNTLKKQGINIKMMNPKEGIMAWVCGLTSTVKGRCRDMERYDFMGAMLAPESGYLIEQYGYGHANQESFKWRRRRAPNSWASRIRTASSRPGTSSRRPSLRGGRKSRRCGRRSRQAAESPTDHR